MLLFIFSLAMTGFAIAQSDYDDNISAAKNGDADAQFHIAWLYFCGDGGVDQDFEKAVYWCRKAANQGHIRAQSELGYCYFAGEGVAKDYKQAVMWLSKAAKEGYAEAQDYLALCYSNGYGVPKDEKLAFDWYNKAADQGFAASQYSLGIAYYHGLGVKQDYELSVYWLRKSEENGFDSKGWLFKAENRLKEETERKKEINILTTQESNQSKKQQEHSQKYVLPIDNNIPLSVNKQRDIFALVVGNEKYKNEVDVPFANNDAKIFSEYVEKTLGVPNDQIRLVENAGYNDLRMAVNWLAQAMTVCRGKGKAIVYYAGHGIPNESDLSAYLLPVDGIGNDPGSAYSLKDMYEKLGGVEAQSITIFLDACFSGSKREEGMLASARGVALKAKQSAPKGNMVIFSAAQGDETAYPYKDKQHGLFTYFLLKKLQESKGEVTLGELSEYLTEEVGRQSFVKNNKMQTPTVNVSSPLENSWRQMKLK